MRNFFKSELENLHIKTGSQQYSKLSEAVNADGQPDGERQIKLLLDLLEQSANEFPDIPQDHKKRIIQQAIIRDPNFVQNSGLTPRFVWCHLNAERAKYFKEEAHKPTESKGKPVTYDQLSEPIKKQVDDFIKELSSPSKFSVHEVTQSDIDSIKMEDLINESKSVDYIPNPELVIMHNKRIEWIRKYHDPITGERNNDWLSFEEYTKMDKNI